MNILLSVDGVLRNDTGELIPDGLIIYRAMQVLGRVVLVTEENRTHVEVWLMLHNLADYDDLIDSTVCVDPDENVRFRQLSVARSKGGIALYIDSNPSYVAEGLRRGITSLLFSCPEYSRPEYRPDAPTGIRKWDDLVAERTRQQVLRAADVRMKKEEGSHFE